MGGDGPEDVETGGPTRGPDRRNDARRNSEEHQDDEGHDGQGESSEPLIVQRDDDGIAEQHTPTTMPCTAPSSAVITDSQRTEARICDRYAPTARNSPSSRVRSYTDRLNVLAMPNTAMRMANASSP